MFFPLESILIVEFLKQIETKLGDKILINVLSHVDDLIPPPNDC